MNMVNLNIPANIVADSIKNAPSFTSADAKCLESRGAPSEVVQAAKMKADAADAMTEPAQPRPTKPSKPQGRLVASTTPRCWATSTSTSRTEEEPPPLEGDNPPALEDAIQARNQGKPATAAQELYRIHQAGMFPQFESVILFNLAMSLYELEMYHSAQHYFMEVVRKGPKSPYFKWALPKLVTIARATGNDYELLKIAPKIPAEDYPRQARNELNYLMGRRLYAKDKLSESAEYFDQVSGKSVLYQRAKYHEGVINEQQQKLRSSVTAFREVVSTNPEGPSTSRQRQEVEDLKDLAYINIGRIYFGLERFDNADTYYSLVERDSTYWPQSLFERAWTNFWRADLNLALGLLLTVESPYFDKREFIPEVSILRALTFFNFCEYEDVERELMEFETKYKPMQEEIEAFVEKYRPREVREKAYDAFFELEHEESLLDEALFARVLRNRDLGALVRHLQMMDDEVASIDTRPAGFIQGIGDELKRVIESDRSEYKTRAGGELLKELVKQNSTIKDLLVQSEIIRFEVVDAQRSEYEFRAQNLDDLQAGEQQRIDFAVNRDIIYWPFNGEFWRDELGYYRYTEYGSCQ